MPLSIWDLEDRRTALHHMIDMLNFTFNDEGDIQQNISLLKDITGTLQDIIDDTAHFQAVRQLEAVRMAVDTKNPEESIASIKEILAL